MTKKRKNEPFLVRDCSLAAVAVGVQAQSLRELRDKIATIHPGSIYHHFWGGRLRPQFEHPEYHNDFAAWAHHALHDNVLAERLGVIDPTDFKDLEGLRQELIDVIEERLDEQDWLAWARREDQFHFIRSQIVVFSTPLRIETPADMQDVIPSMSASSIFYHFIDARRRTPEFLDDFCTWLNGFDGKYDDLIQGIGQIDPYFLSLVDLKQRLSETVSDYLMGVGYVKTYIEQTHRRSDEREGNGQ